MNAKSTAEPVRVDPDEALRGAIKAAVDAGDIERASALLAVLGASKRAAPVVDLEARRRRR